MRRDGEVPLARVGRPHPDRVPAGVGGDLGAEAQVVTDDRGVLGQAGGAHPGYEAVEQECRLAAEVVGLTKMIPSVAAACILQVILVVKRGSCARDVLGG